MTFPIKPDPTWDIRDSSKLDDYLSCPRLYFFKHILGWRIDSPQHDLYFGQAWHIAREYMLIHGYDDVQGAYKAFMDYYQVEYPEETSDLYKPKNAEAVLLAIAKIADFYKRDLLDNELLFTEISGSVPVDEKRVLYFRMDSVLRNKEKGYIFSWDHKTTKRFSRQWEERFHLSMQNGTYTHCLYCLYPEEMKAGLIKGVEFCGTEFNFLKRGSKLRPAGYNISFQRVSAWKNPRAMNCWLWNTVDLLDDLDRDMERLFQCKENDPVMMTFRQNPNSCTNYWGCPFHDYCLTWGNPLQHCFEPPLGFKQEFWNPMEMETTNEVKLKWEG